uniref:Lipocalin n=1 Tax=Rhipicephalus zambeziensis TaxID=60191 RepID=A0A224YC74_9ACAR
MAPLRLSIVIVLVVCTATQVHSFTWKELRDGCKTTDINRFWNTTEPIWTFATAAQLEQNMSCLVDVKINQTGSYSFIDRSYRSDKKERRNLDLKGYVSVGNDFSFTAMLLYHANNSTLYASEILLYQSKNDSCGVFKFTIHPDVFRLDLRVKNSSVASGPDPGCYTFFLESYEQHKKWERTITNVTLYDASCPAVIKSPTSGC